MKRHGAKGTDDSFFSTSHIASLPLLKNLENKKAVDAYTEKIAKLLDVFKNDKIDKKELYKENGKQKDVKLFESKKFSKVRRIHLSMAENRQKVFHI